MKYTSQILKKIIILAVVFCVTVMTGVFLFMRREEKKEPVYTPFTSASLPVLYMDVEGEQVNALYGYRKQMQAQYIRDTITPLAADRRLTVTAGDCDEEIINIEYEIRSLDTSRLVEDTQLKQWDTGEDGVTAVLPIENLLEEGREYLLTLILSTETRDKIYYYTRITLSQDYHTREMMDFVKSFHEKTFDPAQAEDLVVYMRQNTANRNTLAQVSLHSTYAQITWGDLSPRPVGDARMEIKDLNETIGSFTLTYQVEADNPEKGNETERYDVEEFYCVQWSESQWYLLSFERTMNQVFDPLRQVSTSGIDLGILQDDGLQAVRSDNGQWTAFVVNGQLWSCHPQDGTLTRVFCFEQEGEQDLRDRLRAHEIQIVEMTNEGNINFFVYGYMNNGVHEGAVGMSFFEYNQTANELTEVFYLSSTLPYQVLREEVGTLSYLSQSGLFYLMFDSSIFAIDFEGNEFVTVVEQVREESMAISADSSMIAWQDGPDASHGERIHVMNLDSVEQYTIEAKEGEYIKALDFIEQDLICGIAREADVDTAGSLTTLFPMYAVEIYADAPEPETRYEKDGIYISGIAVEPGSIKLYRMQKTASGKYLEIPEDALIQNGARDEGESEVLAQNYSDIKRNVYVIEMERGNGMSGPVLRGPSGILRGSVTELNLQGQDNGSDQDEGYYAYAGGKLVKICATAAEAIQLTYDDVGTVVYGDGNYVLRRGYREPNGKKITISAVTAATPEDSLAACLEIVVKMAGESVNAADQIAAGEEPVRILREKLPGNAHDLTGCGLQQILYYYLSYGYPLIARTADQGALLITGYGYQDINLYSPVTGEETTMGIEEAAAYFERNENVFIGYVP